METKTGILKAGFFICTTVIRYLHRPRIVHVLGYIDI